MRINILLFIFLVSIASLNAQSKKNLITEEEDEVNHLYEGESYAKAVELYEKAYSDDPSRIDIAFKIAECYDHMMVYDKMEVWYELGFKYANKNPEMIYKYARALKLNGNYLKAKNLYSEYITNTSLLDKDKENYQHAIAELNGCIMALDDEKKAFRDFHFELIKGDVNSMHFDYAPAIYKNDTFIVITSSRITNKSSLHEKYGEAYSDNYLFKKNAIGDWKDVSREENFYGAINSSFNDGAGTFTKDKKKYYYTDCSLKNEGKEGSECAIYVSNYKGGKWQKGEKLSNKINAKHTWNAQPTFSTNEDTMYFVSKRKGGYGKHDIWFSVKQNKDDEWSEAQNLGPQVNTVGIEMSPFVDAKTNKFFFASDGHIGFGGLDLFEFALGAGPIEIENLGAPFNSPRDDFYFVIGEKYGYLSSNRSNGLGKDDIYMFTVAGEQSVIAKVEKTQTDDQYLKEDISADLVDSRSHEPIANKKVYLLDNDNRVVDSTISNKYGQAVFTEVDSSENYSLKVDEKNTSLTKVHEAVIENLQVESYDVIDKDADKGYMMLAYVDKEDIKDEKVIHFKSEVRYNETDKPVEDMNIVVMDHMDNVVANTKTDDRGRFYVDNLPGNNNYKVVLDHKHHKDLHNILKPDSLNVYTTTRNLKMKVPYQHRKMFFFKLDKHSIENAEEISVQSRMLNAEGKDLSHISVMLMDEDGGILKTTSLSKNGELVLDNIPMDNNYNLVIEDLGENESFIDFEPLKIKSYAEAHIKKPFEFLFFAYNSSELKEEAKVVLNDLLSFTQSFPDAQIELVANTDSIGSSIYNFDLSRRRAESVEEYLFSRGFDRSKLVIIPQGKNDPLANNNSEEGRQINRRVELYVLNAKGFVSPYMTYIKEKGVDLKKIASRFGMTVNQLKDVNELESDSVPDYEPLRVRKIYESAVYLPTAIAFKEIDMSHIYENRYGIVVPARVSSTLGEGKFFVRGGENISSINMDIKLFDPAGQLVFSSKKLWSEYDFRKNKEENTYGTYTYIIKGQYANGKPFEKLSNFKFVYR